MNLKQLKNEARDEFLGLCPTEECEACKKDAKIIDSVVERVYAAGKEAGRNEGADALDVMRELLLRSGPSEKEIVLKEMNTWARKLEAARSNTSS